MCNSHEQIFDTAGMSHSKISWLESSNSQVGIFCETSSHSLHPLLSSASAQIASSESRTSGTLHLSSTVCTDKLLLKGGFLSGLKTVRSDSPQTPNQVFLAVYDCRFTTEKHPSWPVRNENKEQLRSFAERIFKE